MNRSIGPCTNIDQSTDRCAGRLGVWGAHAPVVDKLVVSGVSRQPLHYVALRALVGQ